MLLRSVNQLSSQASICRQEQEVGLRTCVQYIYIGLCLYYIIVLYCFISLFKKLVCEYIVL
jgi:hypothetical protein